MLGGQLGLWIGGSVLSLMQVIVFMMQFMLKKFSDDQPAKVQQQNGENLTNKLRQHSNLIMANDITSYGTAITETSLTVDDLINNLRQQSSDSCRPRSGYL